MAVNKLPATLEAKELPDIVRTGTSDLIASTAVL